MHFLQYRLLSAATVTAVHLASAEVWSESIVCTCCSHTCWCRFDCNLYDVMWCVHRRWWRLLLTLQYCSIEVRQKCWMWQMTTLNDRGITRMFAYWFGCYVT